jgi:hypothetical protein
MTTRDRASGFFETVYQYVSGFNPIAIILFYGLMTLGFGFIYWILPSGSFYAPYTQFEPTSLQDRKAFADLVAGAIKRQAPPAGDQLVGQNGESIGVKSIRIRNVQPIAETEIKMQLWVPYTTIVPSETKDTQPAVNASLVRLNLILSVGIVWADPQSYQAFAIKLADPPAPTRFEQERSDGYFKLFFDRTPSHRPLLMLSRDEGDRAREILDQYGGNPSSDTHSLLRLLYLSTVVVTTLGLGDIVPMTWLARLCVGLEAFLGVIVAGLFLNSIFAYAARIQVKNSNRSGNSSINGGS